jgi:hypothetical protein
MPWSCPLPSEETCNDDGLPPFRPISASENLRVRSAEGAHRAVTSDLLVPHSPVLWGEGKQTPSKEPHMARCNPPGGQNAAVSISPFGKIFPRLREEARYGGTAN